MIKIVIMEVKKMKMISKRKMKEEGGMISTQVEEITTRQTTAMRRIMMQISMMINIRMQLHLEANNTVNIMTKKQNLKASNMEKKIL